MDSRDIVGDESSIIYWLFETRAGFIFLLIMTGILSELNTRLRGPQPRKSSLFERRPQRVANAAVDQTDTEKFYTPESSPVTPAKTF